MNTEYKQRPIRFRAFQDGVMYYLESKKEEHNHYLQVGSDGFWLYNSDGERKAATEDGGIIMQFIELQGKDGKDVYEDDWCRAQFRDKDGYHVVQGRIIMYEHMWCLDASECSVCPDIYSINRLHDFEVLGNVYEHAKELNLTN